MPAASHCATVKFQSTLSVRRATHTHSANCTGRIFQSTLSVRRATAAAETAGAAFDLFQSTLSVRRATRARCENRRTEYISIHALRKESDALYSSHTRVLLISIHALRKESDRAEYFTSTYRLEFQSTLSVRRATSLQIL